MSRRLTIGFFIAAVVCGSRLAAQLQDQSVELPRPFSVRLVDGDGLPVSGVSAGLGAVQNNIRLDSPTWRYRGGDRKDTNVVSDKDGMIQFADGRHLLEFFCLVARHEDRGLVAIASLDKDEDTQTFVVTLRPEIKVGGRVTCKQIESYSQRDPKREFVLRTCINIYKEEKLALECWFRSQYDISLSPGEYRLQVRDADGAMYRINQPVSVTSGQETVGLCPIDIQLTNLKLLEGEKAPEFIGVTCWKNSKPLTISQLRGRVVLLDFFGYWCGPCVHQMPKLFELHDKYNERGLEIVGIHVDLGDDESEPVDSVGILDERLEESRKELWNGRDLPFPVALVSGHEAYYGDEKLSKGRGELAARYGVVHYPTHVLIDRDSRVVGEFNLNNDESIKQLEELLSKE